MSTERFLEDSIIPILIKVFDFSGDEVTTADMVAFIYDASTKQFWNGTTFQVARTSVALTEVDETNHPGLWELDGGFDTSNGATAVAEYVVEFEDLNGFARPSTELNFLVGGYLDPLIENVIRILGLSHENFVLEPTAFAVTGVMTSGDVYLYDTAANATADGRTALTGLTGQHNILAPIDSETGQQIKFTQIKVS